MGILSRLEREGDSMQNETTLSSIHSASLSVVHGVNLAFDLIGQNSTNIHSQPVEGVWNSRGRLGVRWARAACEF